MAGDSVTLRDIERAREAIAPRVRRTPLVPSTSLSRLTGASMYLKLETEQDTGSFKIRGATNRLLSLSDGDAAHGVVAVSTGNHGRAVAHAAKALGIGAIVCLSNLVPGNKVQAIRDLGAEVRIVGDSQDEAEVEAGRLVAEEGMVTVSPFDDRFVIAGQGTIGLEILEDMPEVDSVLVPVSGGGLVSGIAVALKSARPGVRVVGVSMERGPAMYHSQQAGRPVQVDELPSLADSLGGGIGLDNRYTFALVRDYVDDLVLVGEGRIVAAMAHAYKEEGLVAEGGGAVGIAALLEHRAGALGRNVVVVVSGGNVDDATFARATGASAAG